MQPQTSLSMTLLVTILIGFQLLSCSRGEQVIKVGPLFRFSPEEVNVTCGEIVIFEWTGILLHNVVTSEGETCQALKEKERTVDYMDSGFKMGAGSFNKTFANPGTINFHCTPHCLLGMKGKIVVSP